MKPKYATCATHTAATTARPTGTFAIRRNEAPNTSVTGPSSMSFAFTVIARFFAKPSSTVRYSFVPWNHASRRSELRAKQYAAPSRNGTVGRTGSTAPSAPSPKQAKPPTAHRARRHLAARRSLSFVMSILPSADALRRQIVTFV